MARLPLQTNARAGTIELVDGYRTSVNLKTGRLYRARPLKSVLPPDIYIDRITEGAEGFTREENQRVVLVALRVIWGTWDAGDAVDQRDRFVDGFYAWVTDHYHAFGANSEVNWISVSDNPEFVPEWQDGSESYFMTEIILEGRAST